MRAAALVLALLLSGAHAAHPARPTEEGKASWYGGKFHGRKTASGETFDKNAMTAAHRTLPFGTLARVTNLDNGLVAVVRINDRGPWIDGRILDGSEAVARELDYRGRGITRVRVEVLGQVPPPSDGGLSRKERRKLDKAVETAGRSGELPPQAEGLLLPVDPATGPFAVQVGAFARGENAHRLAGVLADHGFPAEVAASPDGLWRVRCGGLPDRAAAEAQRGRLQAAGWGGFITRDDAR